MAGELFFERSVVFLVIVTGNGVAAAVFHFDGNGIVGIRPLVFQLFGLPVSGVMTCHTVLGYGSDDKDISVLYRLFVIGDCFRECDIDRVGKILDSGIIKFIRNIGLLLFVIDNDDGLIVDDVVCAGEFVCLYLSVFRH